MIANENSNSILDLGITPKKKSTTPEIKPENLPGIEPKCE
jgi:hypothetical protein